MLPATLRLGPVELTVSDLARSIAWWEHAIGVRAIPHGEEGSAEGARAHLVARGAPDGAEPLVTLVELPGARPADGHSGLFHIAILTPDRPSLARWLAHAARERVPLTGMSDHFVSEAIYLRDPDHHGIEIYADRPRAQWEGQVGRMGTARLDTDSLLAELPDPATEPFAGLPAGTTVGHVHLRVASIPETVAWYRDVLGFDLMVQFGGQAAFLAAGGYHHHFGTNTWESAGRGQAPAGTATLRHATVVLPSATDVEAVAARVAAAGQQPEPYAATGGLQGGTLVRDPSGNPLLLVAAAAG